MYQVSIESRLNFQRYTPDKINIVKTRQENNSMNIEIGLWFLHVAISLVVLYQY